MLTLADKGGRGVWAPPFLADTICEQLLITGQRRQLSWAGDRLQQYTVLPQGSASLLTD